jgi:hypothetical protein
MAEVTMDKEYAAALEAVAEAASDYERALNDREFREMCGGMRKVKADFAKKVGDWESMCSEMADVI